MSDLTSHIRSNTDLFIHEFENITHNLANANTPGFKRRSLAFTTALQTQQRNMGGGTTGIKQSPLQARPQIDFSQGKLNKTDRPLDLALNGPGFFTIDTPQGQVYTRNGVFHLDSNGQLVDAEGHTVSGDGGQPITIPPTTDLNMIQINPDGRIKADGQAVGKLNLVTFPNQETQLTASGSGSYRAAAEVQPVPATDKTVVRQGYQEASNVESVKEMVGMISVSRLYEANMKFMTAKSEASQALMQVAMG